MLSIWGIKWLLPKTQTELTSYIQIFSLFLIFRWLTFWKECPKEQALKNKTRKHSMMYTTRGDKKGCLNSPTTSSFVSLGCRAASPFTEQIAVSTGVKNVVPALEERVISGSSLYLTSEQLHAQQDHPWRMLTLQSYKPLFSSGSAVPQPVPPTAAKTVLQSLLPWTTLEIWPKSIHFQNEYISTAENSTYFKTQFLFFWV